MKKNKTVISAGTLYDFNKGVLAKAPALPEETILNCQKKIEDWFNEKIDCYAMLLNNDRRDYTVFRLYGNPPANPNPCEIAARECIGCLTDRGEILDMGEKEDGAWEFWTRIDGEVYVYYLFPYDKAVIEC